ncbi:MAG TPA: 3-deoxy-D-manno-octulosonic acid transferase [Candidatus Megaira endosymbiont of Nemacystus decipiens]|nr:3-deoxy-D-manno-octulosonic acid transferase [Candidatus Megaera endosymbiont of Nemacystus decipiens]
MKIIYIYNIINSLLIPVYMVLALIRIVAKKDTIDSVKQRFGIYKKSRPKGNLLWIHAASLGESMVATTLIELIAAKYPNYKFLITTTTLSSRKILKKHLGRKVIHQFVPVDSFFIVKRFINYWKPNLALFVESELWPSLIHIASQKCDLLLINARLSNNSYNKWQKRKAIFYQITSYFKSVITQSENDLLKFKSLGCKTAINLGNLKFANKELEINESKLLKLQENVKDKPILVVASSHSEDEKIFLKFIAQSKKAGLNYYPIIVLRHPHRRNELTKLCKKIGITCALRSETKTNFLKKDLYIVDTFSELGLFYQIAYAVFVGGSFKRGGHNIVEPAYFDNIVLFGPDISNFQDIANEMISSNAAIQISDIKELSEKIQYVFNSRNHKKMKTYRENALQYVSGRTKISEDYIKHISKFLDD